MSLFSRRTLLSAAATTAAFGGVATLAHSQNGHPVDSTSALRAYPYRSEVEGYGPLRTDPAGLFDLPAGFSYRIVSRAGMRMSDGLFTPGKFDGMGCFHLGEGRVALVRNHELKSSDFEIGPFGKTRALASKISRDHVYDYADDGKPHGGGTTTTVWDMRRSERISEHLSLAGTLVNCAGGHTPWGSWLSCEETLQGKGVEAQADHGWVFEVPADATGLVEPRPIKAMGRFRHEAACVDPATGIVYMTEDMGDGMGLFYRYLPHQQGWLHAGGKLQALGVKGDRDIDLRNAEAVNWKAGESRDVVWIDLDGVDNPYEDLRFRGRDKGAAWFSRGEGVFFGDNELYFTCTSGGVSKLGQIMRYTPSPREGQPGEADTPGRIELFVEPDDKSVLEMGDNLVIAPWGHLIVCEDKVGGVNFLRGVTPEGKIYTIARNPRQGGDVGATSELAGACFSPDGSTLFLNLYNPGTTLAVTGPWKTFRG